jgi:MFS family permease
VRLPFFYGWVIVGAAFVTMGIGVNARTAFSLLFPPILDEFGWERGLTAGAFAVGFVVSTPFAPWLGWLMDRRGARALILLGVAMMPSRWASPRA